MTEATNSSTLLSSAWEVFGLFMIPVGGGIPAGVVLAKKRGLSWIIMTILYFISDICLAFLFEPITMLFVAAGKRSPLLARVKEAMKKSVKKQSANYGVNLGPLSLIMLSFGVDPMTGRSAALAAGHGFVAGWALAIIGDMFFFLMIMASTLWLEGILGDGTATTLIIMVAMMLGPGLVRKVRDRFRASQTKSSQSLP